MKSVGNFFFQNICNFKLFLHLKEAQKRFESESESHSLQPHELYSPWNSSGQNTGVDNYFHVRIATENESILQSMLIQLKSFPPLFQFVMFVMLYIVISIQVYRCLLAKWMLIVHIQISNVFSVHGPIQTICLHFKCI